MTLTSLSAASDQSLWATDSAGALLAFDDKQKTWSPVLTGKNIALVSASSKDNV